MDLLYEGEYKNGQRNGKGKKYRKGDLICEGDFLNGEFCKGKGKKYFLGFLVYEGEMKNGKENGKGI